MRNFLLAATSAAVLIAAPALAQTAGGRSPMTAGKPDARSGAMGASATGPGGGARLGVNPLLRDWTGPYGGVPPFDKVRVEDFQPALEEGMAAELREIDAIADDPAPPTFENTIAAMERAGRPLGRAQAVFGIWSSNMSSPEFQKVEQAMSPKLAAFSDQITQNPRLFPRIDAVYRSPDKARLTPEQQRLTWYYWNQFSREGANLNPAQKAELSQFNQRLAGLYTQFSQNELWDEEHYALTLDTPADLAGLPQSQIDAAAAEAQRRGQPGKWVIANTRSSMEPFLTYASVRPLREKGWRMWIMRGDNGDAHDNNKIVTEILRLRARKAKLLGYPTYAHWRLADVMAKTPDNAMKLMMQAWTPAVAQVHRDVADMQRIVDSEHGGFRIAPWDYRYYAEKLRKAKYDLDLNEVKPYLQLERVRQAMFWAAGQLYGFTFTRLEGVPVYQADMSVYEVKDRDGRHIGLWYFDPYARAGKNSGAWMNAYREQQKLDGDVATIVSNNANFIKGSPGRPVLISWDDANTMFHEFGHALHGLNSNVTYPSLSGTNVARDFVEFPSQLNENWLMTPEVLRFLVNGKGQPIPAELVAKIERARTFNQAFAVTEAQASAIVDMKLHLAGETPIEPHAFEKATLAEIGMPSEIVMRHRIPQFGHVFSGEGYAAGYYGYLWAEVLDRDAFEAFKEAGNPWDKATAQRLHDTILSVGDTVDPAVAYRNFRGRDPRVEAYLRSKGFPVTAQTAGR